MCGSLTYILEYCTNKILHQSIYNQQSKFVIKRLLEIKQNKLQKTTTLIVLLELLAADMSLFREEEKT